MTIPYSFARATDSHNFQNDLSRSADSDKPANKFRGLLGALVLLVLFSASAFAQRNSERS